MKAQLPQQDIIVGEVPDVLTPRTVLVVPQLLYGLETPRKFSLLRRQLVS